MSLITDLEHKRAQIHHTMTAILDRADREQRAALSPDEAAEFDRLTSDLDTYDQRLQELRDQEKRENDVREAMSRIQSTPVTGRHVSSEDRDLDAAFRTAVLSNDRRPIEVLPRQRRSGWQPGVEARTVSTTSGSGLTGTTFYNRLVSHLVEGSAVLAAGATLLQTDSGEALRVPTSTAFSTAAIVAEGGAIGASDPTLGTTALSAYKYAFQIQVTTELVQDSAFDLLGFLAEQAGLALANGAGAHFVTGTGSSQPSGVATGATVGVTGGTAVAGAFTADNLIDLYYSVAAPYARSRSAGWLMRNATLASVRKLKDSQNRYLFSQDVPPGTGAAGTLLGRPVYVDPNVAAVGLSARSILFGDFSRYFVRQVGPIRFARSDDYAFGNDLVTFRALARLDGALVDTTGAVKAFVGGAS
ncbi:phage major capsid protein [Kineosporia sp. R_H_3]|uniref:phage major capsid protein n=1 Tax=Kineosporia sp. R_H_3 TaxID=1961848 RepID=UPI000B4A6FDF|nr:phage major capsid protein [Kineosporia sp. R_H_3]